MIKATSRNRVILPYLRRLFETRKSALVTLKRAEAASRNVLPDDEIKNAYTERMTQLLNVALSIPVNV